MSAAGHPPRLSGVIPVLSMPFDEHEAIDHAALEVEAEHLLAVGVHGLAFGFGSELPRLTERERDDALRTVVAVTGGRVPVMAAVVAASTRAARARCDDAAASGADVVMVTPPPADGPGVRRSLTEVADEAPRPLVIQDAPAATGIAMAPDLLVDLAAHERVSALKLESPDAVTRIAGIRARIGGSATLLGGSGGLEFLAELRAGSRGTMPGAGHAAVFVRLWDAWEAGDLATAETLFGSLQAVLVLATRAGDAFLGIQKTLLMRAGVLPSAALRQPAEALADQVRIELDHGEARLASALEALQALETVRRSR